MAKKYIWITGMYIEGDRDWDEVDAELFVGTRAQATKHLKDLLAESELFGSPPEPGEIEVLKKTGKHGVDLAGRDIVIRVLGDYYVWAVRAELKEVT